MDPQSYSFSDLIKLVSLIVRLPLEPGQPNAPQRRLLLQEASRLVLKISPKDVYAADKVEKWAEGQTD